MMEKEREESIMFSLLFSFFLFLFSIFLCVGNLLRFLIYLERLKGEFMFFENVVIFLPPPPGIAKNSEFPEGSFAHHGRSAMGELQNTKAMSKT